MPIKIPNNLPAAKVLAAENIFVMDEQRAIQQDIRPLRIAIVNLMPTKNETEIQLLRLLGGTPLQVEVDLVEMASHTSKNTAPEHLASFYKSFADIQHTCYDGMIITGAPVETMPFENVDYWPELCDIMRWSTDHVYSVFHICWGAQAGLYFHYGIDKHPLGEKLSGIFPHVSPIPYHPLMRGLDDVYYVPHSRYTTVLAEEIETIPDLILLSKSPEAGVHIAASLDARRIFVTGHSEYDRDTLAGEYARDTAKGLDIPVPSGYFPQDDPWRSPVAYWRSHAHIIYYNWINFIVYQNTPFDISSLPARLSQSSGKFR
jgi:homoserine O-succinyltransferase